MAVYRSDQAQLTFGTEAAPGGYPEIATTATMTGSKVTTGILNAGSSSLTLSSAPDSGMIAGAFICIGAAAQETELRKIEHVDSNTLFLDAPVGFTHPSGVLVRVASGLIADVDANKFITLVPGVYETVDVPDPDMTIEARYLLGTQSKRNFYVAYKGQQTYTGSVPGFILLDGRALRYPIGKVETTVNATGPRTYLSNNASKGDVFITIASTTNLVVDDLIGIDTTVGTTPSSGGVGEIRKIVGITGTVIKLDYPLSFAHTAAGSGTTQIMEIANTGVIYYHHISETVDLDTVSWHLHMRDSGETPANDFDRRYYGGLIGGATLSADEGGMLNMSWDGVNFQGMVHNQKKGNPPSSEGVTTTGDVPFYSYMQSIDSDNVVFPTTEPYYFSQGSVTIFGQEIARIRNFSLSIANNEEPRYYIQRRFGRNRGPTEIREQRREYSLSVTLALPDSTPALTEPTARLFNELLWEGDYGAGSGTGMQGFNLTLRFDRGAADSIVITIPDDGTAATGGNEQGAFIRTAPHAISGENPLQVDADVLFRNLKILVTDSVYYYP